MGLIVRVRRILGLALVVAVGLASAGCVMSRGEFAQPAATPIVLTGAQPQDIVAAPAQAEPTVAVQQDSPVEMSAPLALSAVAQGEPATAGYPAINAPPGQPKSKLLSPEEKARLIAELEALARSQEARAAASKAACDDEAAQALDPEQQRLNGDFAAGEC